jgi:hypothetical protein
MKIAIIDENLIFWAKISIATIIGYTIIAILTK